MCLGLQDSLLPSLKQQIVLMLPHPYTSLEPSVDPYCPKSSPKFLFQTSKTAPDLLHCTFLFKLLSHLLLVPLLLRLVSTSSHNSLTGIPPLSPPFPSSHRPESVILRGPPSSRLPCFSYPMRINLSWGLRSSAAHHTWVEPHIVGLVS